jgi:hypothetical protein
MNFSIILPTRNRVDLFINLCRSIDEKTHDLNNIEMLAACDLDDRETCKAMLELMGKYRWLCGHMRDRGNSISKDYQNWLYPLTKGKYIFVINDDVEFMTCGWDSIVMQKIQEYIKIRKDGIFYGWISDSNNKRIYHESNSYSCFPILTRKGIDTLGYVMHEHYGGWSADIFLYNVYKDVDRILNLSEVLLQHYSHWIGNREKDETAHSMHNKSINTDIIDHKPEARKLRKIIRQPFLL